MTDTLQLNGASPAPIALAAPPNTDSPDATLDATPALAAIFQGTPAPAAEAQPIEPVELEAPTASAPEPEPDAQLNDDTIVTAISAPDRPWQVGDFGKYKDKYIIEITAINEPVEPSGTATFDGHSIWLQKDDSLMQGKSITDKPLSVLKPIQRVTTILKLRIGLELRQMTEYDRLALRHANAAGEIKKTLTGYLAAKEAITQMVPDAATLTW